MILGTLRREAWLNSKAALTLNQPLRNAIGATLFNEHFRAEHALILADFLVGMAREEHAHKAVPHAHLRFRKLVAASKWLSDNAQDLEDLL